MGGVGPSGSIFGRYLSGPFGREDFLVIRHALPLASRGEYHIRSAACLEKLPE
jgi:hypothetical protein